MVIGTVLSASFIATVLLIPKVVRIDAVRGDWQRATEGLKLSDDAQALSGKGRGVVHFHRLDGSPGTLHLSLSSPDHENSSRARVTVGEKLGETTYWEGRITSEVRTIAIPLSESARDLDVGVEVTGEGDSSSKIFLINEILLFRRPSVEGSLFRAIPVLISLLSLLYLSRREKLVRAVIGALLAGGLGAGAIVVIVDSASALALSENLRTGLRVIALVILWSYVLTSAKSRLHIVIGVVGTVVILHLPSLFYGFYTDDFLFARPLTWPQIMSTFYGPWEPHGDITDYYRPVSAISLFMDYSLWGEWPPGYHTTNLVLIVIAALLVHRLARNLGLTVSASMLAALAMSAHPVSVASASWVSQRTDSLMMIGYVGTLVYLLKPTPSKVFLPTIGLLGAAALGAKETAVTLPLTALVLIITIRLPERRTRYLAAAVLLCVVVLYVVTWSSLFPGKAKSATGLASQFPTSITEVPHYPLMHVYPGLFLPVTYGWWLKHLYARMPWNYLIVGHLLCAIVLVLISRISKEERWRRIALFGGLWPLLTSPPLLGLKGGVDFYRLGLLMSVGYGLMLGAGFALLLGRRSSTAAWPAVPFAVWLSLASIPSGPQWGVGGPMWNVGTSWRRDFTSWQQRLTPAMHELFWDQIQRVEHARKWIEQRPGRRKTVE
jgi:hypothetical protein